MRERVAGLVGPAARTMWVSTFHSACVRILRREATKVGLRVELLHLRRGRQPAADGPGLPRAGPGPQAVPARGRSAHRSATSRTSWSTRRATRATVRGRAPTTERMLAEAYTAYQRRLRQANALDFDDLIMTTVNILSGRSRTSPSTTAAGSGTSSSTSTRTPTTPSTASSASSSAARCRRCWRAPSTDEPEPERRRRPRPSSPSSATPTSRSTRSAARHPQHPRVRGRLPERPHDPARAELPVDADDPDCRQRGHRQQPGPQAEEAVDRRRRRRARSSATSRDDEHDEAQFVAEEIDRLHRRRRRPARRRRRVLPDQRADPGPRGGLHPGRPAVQGRRRHPVLRARARSRTRSRTCGCSPTPPTPSPCAGSSTCPSAGSVTGPRRASRRSPSGSGSASTRRCCRRRRRPRASRPARVTAITGFTALLDELRDPGRGRRRARRRCSRPCSSRPATSPSCEPARPAGRDPGREPRRARRRGAGVRRHGQPERRRLRTSSSRSRWSPTPTRSPTATTAEARRRRHADDAAHRQGPGVPGRVPHRARGRHLPAHALARRPKELEEERRLAYVGITRARQRLYLSRAAVRSAWGAPTYNPASRFLDEVPARARRLAAVRVADDAAAARSRRCARLAHRPGRALARATATVITSSRATGSPTTRSASAPWSRSRARATRRVAKVDFRDQGVKRLLLRYAPVEKL